MEEMTEKEKAVVIAVTQELVNMLTNNILEDNGTEPFEGWCEDGGVFYYSDVRGLAEAAEELMRKVAPLIDELTYKYLNLGH